MVVVVVVEVVVEVVVDGVFKIVLLCIPCWSGTHYEDQTALEFTEICLSLLPKEILFKAKVT